MKYNLKVVLAYWKQEGLPPVVPEYRFHETRRWRFDFAWPEIKLALEVEGGIFTQGRHTRGSGFEKDMIKYNSAAVLGWRLLRVTPENLCMMDTVRMIKQAMGENSE